MEKSAECCNAVECSRAGLGSPPAVTRATRLVILRRIICGLLLVTSSIAAPPAKPLSAEEIQQKLWSPDLTDGQKEELVKDLPKETKRELEALESEYMDLRKKQSDESFRRVMAYYESGTGHLMSIHHFYGQVSKAAMKNAGTDLQKEEIRKRSEKKLKVLNHLIRENTLANNVTIWIVYEETTHDMWNIIGKESQATLAQLTILEAQLVDPVIRALERDVTALPPDSRGWKILQLVSEGITPPGKPHPTPDRK